MSSDSAVIALPPEVSAAKPSNVGVRAGWIMLGMATAAMFMSAPGQSFSVAAFIDPMLTDLGLLRSSYSTAYLVATLVGGLALPWVGRRLDQWGARRMLPAVAVLLGLACFWMGQIGTLASLYVGFLLIRCLGQGTLSLISTWMIGEWFERRRGLATGLVSLGGTFSVMVIPQLNGFLIDHYGWRTAWVILAAIVWVVLVLPGVLLIRDRPEDIGCRPDWDADQEKQSTEPEQQHDPFDPASSWTVEEAYRDATFWKLLAVICTCSTIGTGLIFHQVSLFAEHGITRIDALRLLGVQAVVGSVSSVVAGYLTDRVEARYLLAASMVFLSAAIVILISMPSTSWVFVYCGLLGLMGGIIRSTGTVVWINYYGRLHQGAIRGFAFSFMVAAAALGPLPLALGKDYLGDYNLVLISFLVLPVLATIGVLTASLPVKPESEPSA